MKRFQFQLEPVLSFKQQGLDALMVELSAIQARLADQEAVRDEAYRQLREYDEASAARKAEGMTVLEAIERQTCQLVLDRRAKEESEKVLHLRRQVEAKRTEVVEARKETHSLEKLRELRRGEYDTALQKAEEKALDDLTAARRAAV